MPKAKTTAADRSSSEQAVQLLDAATEHVLAHGLGDLSLRNVADALGTSHRMLIYYFGSADGFWQALLFRVRHTEQQARSLLVDLVHQSTPQQRRYLQERLGKVRTDFSELKCLKG